MGSMDKTVIFTRGYPGSGKTIWTRQFLADHSGWGDVSREAIGHMLGIDYSASNRVHKKRVMSMQTAMIRQLLSTGTSFIVSDTNLRQRDIKHVAALAWAEEYEVIIKDFIVDHDELLKRNERREDKHIDPDELRDLFHRFPEKNWTPIDHIQRDVENSTSKHRYIPYRNDPLDDHAPAVLVDIDGTLAHHENNRSPYDYGKVLGDEPDEAMIQLVQDLYRSGYKIVILTGRKPEAREDTLTWLMQHNVHYDKFFMRKDHDNRKDWIVKDELIRENIENKYYIAFCLEDRNQVVDHYRAMGLKVLQVAPGDF